MALLQPLGGLLWLLLLPWLLLRLLLRLVLRLLLLLWLALALRLVPWLWLLVLQLLLLWLLLSRGRWPWPLLPVGSGGEGVWRLGLGDWLALQLAAHPRSSVAILPPFRGLAEQAYVACRACAMSHRHRIQLCQHTLQHEQPADAKWQDPAGPFSLQQG